ncbi:PadR family transcriptional regulator [Cohnella soli]|uniref:PadR family transcriptional regulator n=1 Tax=Cohnella soli TaxID=425005 RepID=A0ABW0I0T8_9BACL
MNSQDVLLGMLMRRSLSGYEIKNLYEEIFGYFYNSSYGTIYPTLHRMEKEGLISKESVVQEGKPNKNVYTITEEGQSRFYDYLNSHVESDTYKSDFLMRLYFGHYVDEKLVIDWLQQAEKEIQSELDSLSEKRDAFKDMMQPTQLICIELGINICIAKLTTIREGMARLKAQQ